MRKIGKNLLFTLICFLLFGLGLAAMETFLWFRGAKSVMDTQDPYFGLLSSTTLFEPLKKEGETIYRTRREKLPYFNQQSFSMPKPEGTFRIFVLGGSTVYGRPYKDQTSFTGWLRKLLPLADPNRNWEVINCGGISYASYRLAAMMEELTQYKPDLFVIYTGHNEFLEERSFSRLHAQPNLPDRINATLLHTRSYSMLWRALEKKSFTTVPNPEKSSPLPAEVVTRLESSQGPEDYHRNDPLHQVIIEQFSHSLEKIQYAARKVDAKVLFLVPSSNLSACSPFKSELDSGLTSEERQKVINAKTLPQLEEAVKLSPRHAESWYKLGKRYLQNQNFSGARQAFVRAKDEDVCPLRAVSQLQKKVEAAGVGKNAYVWDFDQLLRNHYKDSIGHELPGQYAFLDHVHLNPETHLFIAVNLLKFIKQSSLLPDLQAVGEDQIASVQQKVLDNLDSTIHGEALHNLAKVMHWAGKSDLALQSARKGLQMAPEHLEAVWSNLLLGTAYHKHERFPQAFHHYRNAYKLDTNSKVLFSHLRKTLGDRGAKHFLFAMEPERGEGAIQFHLGMAFWHAGDSASARIHLDSSLSHTPDNLTALKAAGELASRVGDEKRAQEFYSRLLRLNPEQQQAKQMMFQPR